MPRRQTKQILLLLTAEDEAALAARVIECLPDVRFIDEWQWRSVDSPPVRENVLDCGSIVGIWGSHILKTATGVIRENGTIDGPYGGAIVQWLRCRRAGNTVDHGRWAAAFDPSDEPVVEFVATLWKVVRAMTTNRLIVASGDPVHHGRPERRFRVGERTYDLATRGEIRLTADRLILAPEPPGHTWPGDRP